MKNNRNITGNMLIASLLLVGMAISCQPTPQQKELPPTKTLSFESSTIADTVAFLWAHTPADVTGDGIADLVFIYNNGFGGNLGFFEGKTKAGIWEKHIIAETAPGGGTFAQGDLECADMDFDGDMDIVASEHPGEWDQSDASSVIYWFENPGWKAHRIGEIPNFIKDVGLEDFNQDKKMDLAALTFETNTLSIFQQNGADDWDRVQHYENYKNLHEGMGTGDLDGDGQIDIMANGHIFYNPGADLSAPWKEENMDAKWNTQTGDWSRNGTKAFVRDINGDKKAEVFISHSERPGYPLSYYQQNQSGGWTEHVLADSIPACHTLQVFDFDLDGDFDVLAGINKTRAKDLGFSNYEVTIFLSEDNYASWKPMVIETDGIYNGQAIDFEQDGDYDIFRYQTHDATEFTLMKNGIND